MLRIDEVLHLFTIIKADIEDYITTTKELKGKLSDHDLKTLKLLSQQLLNLKTRLRTIDELQATKQNKLSNY